MEMGGAKRLHALSSLVLSFLFAPWALVHLLASTVRAGKREEREEEGGEGEREEEGREREREEEREKGGEGEREGEGEIGVFRQKK